MPKKRFGAEQIVTLLRQIEVSMAQGKPTPVACRDAGISQQSYRDELLNGEIFYSLKEGQIVMEQWRKHYNTIRPHSSLGYRPPAPQTMNPFLTPLDQAVQMQ
jgi:transposase InsO family protein